MRGASRGSLAAATERVEPLLVRSGADDLGEELFAVVRLLDSSAGLRRALTDPTREGEAKAALVAQLLTGKVGEATTDVVTGLVRSRWSASRDLGDALEHLGALAVVAGAQSSDRLDAVEDELFRFERLVAADPDLRRALRDRAAPPESRARLVEGLLRGKVSPETLTLLRQAAAYPRGRRFEAVVEDFSRIAAARRERLVALVVAAVPLTEDQRGRLAVALARVYGRSMHLNVDVDPDVVGGLRVVVGDEVLDGTVLRRLEDARRHLTG